MGNSEKHDKDRNGLETEGARFYYEVALQQYRFIDKAFRSLRQKSGTLLSVTILSLSLIVQVPVKLWWLRMGTIFSFLVAFIPLMLGAMPWTHSTAEWAKDLYEEFDEKGHPLKDILLQRASTLDDSSKTDLPQLSSIGRTLKIGIAFLLLGFCLFFGEYTYTLMGHTTDQNTARMVAHKSSTTRDCTGEKGLYGRPREVDNLDPHLQNSALNLTTSEASRKESSLEDK